MREREREREGERETDITSLQTGSRGRSRRTSRGTSRSSLLGLALRLQLGAAALLVVRVLEAGVRGHNATIAGIARHTARWRPEF